MTGGRKLAKANPTISARRIAKLADICPDHGSQGQGEGEPATCPRWTRRSQSGHQGPQAAGQAAHARRLRQGIAAKKASPAPPLSFPAAPVDRPTGMSDVGWRRAPGW